ncbi:hypothetical protein QYF36_015211 [Acer negundo]|nr:hypothetical protein QYF36_015211 [Acer negundo]
MAETIVDNGDPPAEKEESTADSFFDLHQDNKVGDISRKMESLDRKNKEMKERITTLTIEVEGSAEDKKLFDSITVRAVELETEKATAEKGEKLDSVEKEIDALKKEKAESEKKVRELERNVGLLEVKEIEEKSKKFRVKEEMRENIDEKDMEIIVFKRELMNWYLNRTSGNLRKSLWRRL